MEELKKLLINNGWGSEGILQALNTENLKNCVDKCTSPAKEDIFNAFKELKPIEVKVLIIGQDPYPDTQKAHGMAFSFKHGELPAQYSLKKIFDCLKGYELKTTNLACWREQGVLLLNSALTFSGKENVDKNVNAWKPFINEIIKKVLSSSKTPLVVMLWGDKARDAFINIPKLTINRKILVLNASHPQAIGDNNTFIDCNHFADCNNFLGENNAIDWSTKKIS